MILRTNKFLYTTISLALILLFTPKSFSNPIDEVPFNAEKNLYNFFVEIPAGSKEKWELDEGTGLLELEQRKGNNRIINFLPYPGNYGFIPQTLSGDGDPVDLIDLDETSQRGNIKQVKILGAMYFEDEGEVDYKFIGASPYGTFREFNSIEELLIKRPNSLEILRIWFLSYKESEKMIFYRFIEREESIDLLTKSHKRWIKKGD